MRSARSASRVLADEVCREPGPWPSEPSLIATTERVERDVWVELGVPGPNSLGVVGSEGGGGTTGGVSALLFVGLGSALAYD